MTKAFAIALLKQDIQNSKQKISYYHNEVGIEALEMAIKALEQTELNSSYNSIKSKLEPCEDCISRAEALHACCDEWNKDYKAIMKSIRQLPSVTPQQTRWIPVSERLPEREGWYLISLGEKTYGGADVDMYCKGWVKYGTHVLAWMPLPEPYKAESEE